MTDHNFEQIFGQKPDRIEALSGGDINQVFRVDTENQSYVIKVNRTHSLPDLFKTEAAGLGLIHRSDSICVPSVIRSGEENDFQFLVLEFIRSGEADKSTWENLGEKLAMLHRSSSEFFGLDHNNYIGSLRQVNTPTSAWTDFYRSQRLQPLIEMAVNQGELNYVEARIFEPFISRLEELIPSEKPSLLHGDLWSGNLLIDSDANPVLIDPAVYYGHREMDLAMMQLFGGFPSLAFDSYHNIFSLEKGWKERIPIHQLYPLLVHLNLFGRSYWNQIRNTLEHYL